MSALLLALATAGAAVWLAVLLAPGRRWSCREVLERPGPNPPPRERPSGSAAWALAAPVTVVIPARNESAVVGRTIRALAEQGEALQVVLVDDGSTDGTVEAALEAAGAARAGSTGVTPRPPTAGATADAAVRGAGRIALQVLPGEPLPAGWTGKTWALEQGGKRVRTPLTLLLDADIELRPGALRLLRWRMGLQRAALVSVMAEPATQGFWASLLMPAFVFYFRLLYPFALSNRPDRRAAAAAGGCVLVETALLEAIGGFARIRGEVIDDCALAREAKAWLRSRTPVTAEPNGWVGARSCAGTGFGEGTGGCRVADRVKGRSTWIGLSREVRSLRRYHRLSDVREMVARTAYVQLRHSPALLLAASLLMAMAHWGPAVGVGLWMATGFWLPLLGAVAMVAAYLPTLRFYGRSPAWALLLPVTGTLYLYMTWLSALRHWRGRGAAWKGRHYGGETPGPPP